MNPLRNLAAAASALLLTAACISVQGKLGPPVAPSTPAGQSSYCLAYATQPTQVHDDPGSVFTSFRTLLSNVAGEIFAGVFNPAVSAEWNLLKLPLAANVAGATASSWSVAENVPIGGAVFGLHITASLRDAAGNLWAVGNAIDAGTAPVEAWVRLSQDGGTTWSQVGTFAGASANAVSADASGAVYVSLTTGVSPDLTADLRRTPDLGSNWTSVFTSQLSVNQPTYFRQIVNLSASTLLLIGTGTDVAANQHGLVFSSTDGGSSFTSINDYHPGTLNTVGFQAARVDASGNLWVTAIADDLSATDSRWQVLRSADGGLNFTVLDDYLYAAGQGPATAGVGAMHVDGGGRIFVPGFVTDVAAKTHGLVRVSADSGATWSTFYDFAEPGGGNAAFYSMAQDSALGLFVAGSGPGGAIFKWGCASR